MKTKLITGVIFALILQLSCAQNPKNNQSGINHVNAIEFKALVDSSKGIVLDVRTPNEYNQGHIKGAVMVDFYSKDFKEEVKKLDSSKPVYLYCRSGNRSSKSINTLKDLGFKEIYNLQNGIIDWQRNGFELIK